MTTLTRRLLLTGTLAATLGSMIIPGGEEDAAAEERLGLRFRRWAADTWASLVAMTDEDTGLTADNIDGAWIRNPVRSGYTSPTNIGGYLWSAIVARDLGLIAAPRVQRSGSTRPCARWRDGAPRAERHVLQLVRRARPARC